MTQIRSAMAVGVQLSGAMRIDMNERLYDLEPKANPLMKLITLSKKNRKRAGNPEYFHLEHRRIGVQTQINHSAGYGSGSTSIVVDDGGIFNINDLVKNRRSGDISIVTNVSTNTLTLTRGFGSTAPAAWVDNDYLVRLGSAYTDGDGVETPNMKKQTSASNYIQIFRRPFGADWTSQATDHYTTPNTLIQERVTAGIEFSREIEHQFLFGEKAIANSTAANCRRQTGGIIYHIATNIHSIGGALTETTFNSHLQNDFRYGSKEKMFFASRTIVGAMAGWGRDRMRSTEGSKDLSGRLGLKVEEYVCPFGTLYVAVHDLFEGDTYDGYGVIVDPDNVGYRYMEKPGSPDVPAQSLDVHIQPKLQTPGDHKDVEEYVAYIGLEVMLEESHALYTGVTG